MNEGIGFIAFMVIVNFFCIRSIIRKLEVLRTTINTTRREVDALQDLICGARKGNEKQTK